MKPRGFTLPQLLTALAVTGILAAAATQSYRSYTADARLRQVQAALLENSDFLHNYYARHQSYKSGSSDWPALPHTESGGFCIRLQGLARGALPGKYTLKAVALDQTAEPRILRTNQDGTFSLCARSTNSCSETADYFAGNSNITDKECSVFR
ncbi:MAG: type IV pilin protein [Neisseria sp.]|nr:type IV pilin protein [Neisseria sp.]